MTIAQQIKSTLLKHYTYNGNLYINHRDAIEHLKANLIGRTQATEHAHNGYADALDGSMCAFFYDDKSILVVACSSGLTASG